MKAFADNYFILVENGGQFSKGIENILGKGVITCYKQILLFPQCVQKTFVADTQKPGLVWEKLKKEKNNKG